MAYTAQNHQHFSERCRRFFLRFQSLREEAGKLDEIYTNETLSGSDPDFDDTSIATKQEHIDAIVFMRAMKDFVENGSVSQLDRTQTITPFVQNPE